MEVDAREVSMLSRFLPSRPTPGLALPAALLATLIVPAARTAASDPGVEFFEKRVRPVLVAHCQECHSQKAKKRRGGLTLDTCQGLRAGGDRGPLLVPGHPEASLLLTAVRYD